MSNQENKKNESDIKEIDTIKKNVGTKNTTDGEATRALTEKFARALDFCKKNARYITAAGLFVVLVIILAKCSGNSTVDPNENTQVSTGNYETNAKEEINQLINNYYTAYANGDVETLAALADPISNMEKSYIAVFSQYVEAYQNITCYTKKGLDDNSYITSAYMEIKFKDVDTNAPGLETFYVKRREDGSLYIDNVYGQFNSQMEEYKADTAVSELLENFSSQEDVIALQQDVQKKYEDALAADEALKSMVETTVPDAITVWASEQAAVAKEEDTKKEEEQPAEEQPTEENKQEEQPAAVSENVYATDKVNVRAEASETAEIIGQLEAGAMTSRFEDKDGWSRIDYNNGTEGYVKSDYLSTEAPAVEAEEETDDAAETEVNGLAEGTKITVQESVNLRESMSQDSAKIATIFAGEKVTVIMSYAEGWTKVSYGEKTGFIKTELLQ